MTTSRIKHKRLDPFYYWLVSNNLKTAMLVNSRGKKGGREGRGKFELPGAASEARE